MAEAAEPRSGRPFSGRSWDFTFEAAAARRFSVPDGGLFRGADNTDDDGASLRET
jgi:hypothetical protein